jgi:benzil reductase ((S)-benzoin forming)
MKKDHYIITGTSRGIGEALAHLLMGPQSALYCISRNPNPGLTTEAYVKKYEVHDITLDLTQHHRITEIMRNVFREIHPDHVNSITLINNAGVIHPIRRVGETDASEKIARNVAVNLTASMLVTDTFVHETLDFNCPKKVVFLTSGAARRMVKGWSAYSAAKAGLEMYVKCLADEQSALPKPIQLMAFSPGVVDTDMQAEIRNANPEDFPELEKFRAFKEQGQLLDPESVAQALVELIHSPEFGNELMVSIRDIRP